MTLGTLPLISLLASCVQPSKCESGTHEVDGVCELVGDTGGDASDADTDSDSDTDADTDSDTDTDTDSDSDTDTDTDTDPGAEDHDGDGYDADHDCDDRDADVNPGVEDDPCDEVDNDCDGVSATPSSHASSDCYSGDVYWYDECGDREEVKDSCGSTSECDGGVCAMQAEDTTSVPTACSSSSGDRNIFTAVAVSVSSADTDPQISIDWEKCDGSAFSTTKTCDVRVGSYASSGVSRTTFTWSSGDAAYTTTIDGWPSASDFEAETCGATKEFYLTCDDGSTTAYWYSNDPVVIEKVCP